MNEEGGQTLTRILKLNQQFRDRTAVDDLPVKRVAEKVAIVTCIDPRINLEALGIFGFSPNGAGNSNVRVIRTIGGIAEERSLIIGLFLAGFKEIVVLMHTDCGCSLAHSKVDTIVSNMKLMLSDQQLEALQLQWGDLSDTQMRSLLRTFEDPREAVKKEVQRIRALPYFPQGDATVHGLLYHVETAQVELVVDGYQSVGTGLI